MHYEYSHGDGFQGKGMALVPDWPGPILLMFLAIICGMVITVVLIMIYHCFFRATEKCNEPEECNEPERHW